VTRTLQIVFLCGARDFHAIDWYRSAIRAKIEPQPVILTDLMAGEGFELLVGEGDRVFRLIVLDKWLFKAQSRLGDIWRNIVKAVVFPVQVVLLMRFAAKNPKCLYYAHSMYYIWLAWAARVDFVGTPQGSDILIKPYRSLIFRCLSRWSMRSALLVTVDSRKMSMGVEKIAAIVPLVIQNGIDVQSLNARAQACARTPLDLDARVVSFRGFTSLYRIHEIILARNRSKGLMAAGIDFVFPFCDEEYVNWSRQYWSHRDMLVGRLSRQEMYRMFEQSLLCVSVPSSDSSPRSVYEAIFCGAVVAATDEEYIRDLPESMRKRIVVVHLEDPHWLDSAVEQAQYLRREGFVPCREAIESYDQLLSFKRLHRISLEVVGQKLSN
jgi:hypothetical protein